MPHPNSSHIRLTVPNHLTYNQNKFSYLHQVNKGCQDSVRNLSRLQSYYLSF